MSELQCVVRDPWPAKFQKSVSASFAWVGLESFTCPKPVQVGIQQVGNGERDGVNLRSSIGWTRLLGHDLVTR